MKYSSVILAKTEYIQVLQLAYDLPAIFLHNAPTPLLIYTRKRSVE